MNREHLLRVIRNSAILRQEFAKVKIRFEAADGTRNSRAASEVDEGKWRVFRWLKAVEPELDTLTPSLTRRVSPPPLTSLG
jgi:hypothetical protein